MYIIKNALSNIRCAKVRNILIGIVVFIIAASSCIALTVKKSAETAEKEALKDLSVTASISYDRQKMMQNAQANKDNTDFREQMQNIKELSLEELKTYAESQNVKEFRYSTTTSVNGSGLDAVDTSAEASSSTAQNETSSKDKMPGGKVPGGVEKGDFSVTGYSAYSGMTDFVSGTSKVSEGAIFDVDSSEYQCIISTELAAYNELSVGDKITVVNPSDENQTYVLTITGLYTYDNTDSMGKMNFGTASDPANKIYTSYNTLNSIIADTTDNATTGTDESGNETTTALTGSTSGIYVFENADAYNRFVEDVKTMGLSDSYTVSSTDLSNYQNSIIPLQNTEKFATMLLWIVLGVGGIILVVLNIFNIRERKYEVGVLTAIGMKKFKVAMQFVVELFIVTFAAIIIGTAAGAALSVPTANVLLENQITAQETAQQEQANNFMPGDKINQGSGFSGLPGRGQQSTNAANNYVSNIHASTDIVVVLELVGIGLLLTIVASLSAVIFIMRYEPLKILSERT